jgi:hypothetical protein
MQATEPLSPVRHPESTGSNGTLVEEAPVSAVSWPAIAGGAFVAAAMGLILLSLGTGLGLSAISPWSNSGISSKTLGIGGAIWLIAMQAIAGGLGGYVAGRLRTKWVAVHTEEAYFRDTAHGFLAWAVAVVISAGLLASAAAALVGAGAGVAGTGLASAGAVAATTSTEMPAARQRPESDGVAYYVDALFRNAHANGAGNEAPTSMEAGRIVAVALSKGDLTPADKTYLSQWVAARTGLNQSDADKRVTETIAQAKAVRADAEAKAREAAEAARKAGAYLSLWVFVSMLAGAFCASHAATIGGRQRDSIAFV